MSSPWQRVIDFANGHACDWAQNPGEGDADWGIHREDPAPYNRLLGPIFARGPASGWVDVGGECVCQFGQPERADMTFSVTKTYLALVAGVAFDQGLIPDLNEPIHVRVPDIGFDDGRNREVTWEQMLQFTSEWSGTCFGVPDQVDHFRRVGFQSPATSDTPKGSMRTLQPPGTFWEYNDVRINQLSLALMHLFARPVPEVFGEFVMDPIAASRSWHWHGYENSWVEIAGRAMQSVPGGGHWGGGMRISARDQARVGRLMLNRGRWQGKSLVSEEWIRRMLSPCEIARFYGYFVWLNQLGTLPAASPESYFAMGVGGHFVWHDPTRDMVAVFRWIDAAHLNELFEQVNSAMSA